MSVFEKHRFKIINQAQHPYKHTLSDFGYVNNRIPQGSSLEDALNIVIAAIWPNYKGTVATPADLPLVATINDYYVVTDDGDGKSAGYVYQMIDNVAQFIKRYDWDWSNDNLLASAINSVAPYYVHKWGTRDRDQTGAFYAGDLAGQRVYGSTDANEHLTFYANAGDAVGNTGFVQFGDNSRPLVHNTFDFGTTTYRFKTGYFADTFAGTLHVAAGSITDSSGAISFDNENLTTTGFVASNTLSVTTSATVGNLSFSNGLITSGSGALSFNDENLSTTGTLASGTHTIGNMIISSASITNTSGNISFVASNLSTTGTLGAGATTVTQLNVDDIRLDGKQISIVTLNTDLELIANGTGLIKLLSDATTLSQTVTGIVTITGQLNADNIRVDSNTLSSTNANGDIILSPNGTGKIQSSSAILPTIDNSNDLGDATHRFRTLYCGTSLNDGTNAFITSELMSLRSNVYRDFARTLPAQAGDALFYDAVNNVWLANHPDTEITHNTLSGLTTGDAGHTQFVMLAGRAGGQVVQGGTAASENLILESTANATKGFIKTKDAFIPFTDATFAVTWQGTDLGGSSNYFRDMYTKGEHKNFRTDSFTFATLPASSATAVGRQTWVTDRFNVYADTGSAWKQVGVNRFISDLAFDGVVTVVNTTVSASIVDARNAIIQLLDNTNDFERIFCSITATSASNVRVTTNLPLPAGSYRLVVLE